MTLAPDWPGTVLRFWLDDVGPSGWFTKNSATDDAVRGRFLGLYRRLASDLPDECYQTPEAALAAVVVLDQFSRNMFRGSPESFAADASALMLATDAVARGHDLAVRSDGRVFFYLPFEHAESLAVQERSVRLISALANPVFTDYAVRHRDVVARFGRFPHRNDVLGRTSSAEEIAFLREPGSSF